MPASFKLPSKGRATDETVASASQICERFVTPPIEPPTADVANRAPTANMFTPGARSPTLAPQSVKVTTNKRKRMSQGNRSVYDDSGPVLEDDDSSVVRYKRQVDRTYQKQSNRDGGYGDPSIRNRSSEQLESRKTPTQPRSTGTPLNPTATHGANTSPRNQYRRYNKLGADTQKKRDDYIGQITKNWHMTDSDWSRLPAAPTDKDEVARPPRDWNTKLLEELALLSDATADAQQDAVLYMKQALERPDRDSTHKPFLLPSDVSYARRSLHRSFQSRKSGGAPERDAVQVLIESSAARFGIADSAPSADETITADFDGPDEHIEAGASTTSTVGTIKQEDQVDERPETARAASNEATSSNYPERIARCKHQLEIIEFDRATDKKDRRLERLEMEKRFELSQLAQRHYGAQGTDSSNPVLLEV